MKLYLALILAGGLLSSYSYLTDNDREYKKAKKQLDKLFAFVPSGTAIADGDSLTVQSFYMSKTEVTNGQYMEFLNDLLATGETEKYAQAALDTNAWNELGGSMNEMASYYHDHPAYTDFPVVNVPKKGAELYCEWLSEKMNKLSGGKMKLNFRVPTRAEFLRASCDKNASQTYAWGGNDLRNKEGCFLANYVHLGDAAITRNDETGELEINKSAMMPNYYIDGSFITAPAKSYFPNEFGLYNLNGNVAEMVSDGDLVVGGDWHSPGFDVRNQSVRKMDGPEPMSGFRVVATYLGAEE